VRAPLLQLWEVDGFMSLVLLYSQEANDNLFLLSSFVTVITPRLANLSVTL
jgi:hypothetical protein